MIQQPDKDIAQHLNDNGLGTFDQAGADIFIGPVRPPKVDGEITVIPERSLWIIAGAGAEPQRVFGHDYMLQEIPVQIMARGQPNQYIDSRDRAQEIWDALEGEEIENYMTCLAMQSGPVWLRFDENQRPQWALNFLLRFQVNAAD